MMSSCVCEPAPASCGCGEKLPAPSAKAGLVVTMATVPMQRWEILYDPATAIKKGTAFPCLDKPFYKTGGEVNG